MNDELAELILRERPPPLDATELAPFWAASAPLRARFSRPFERAVAGGYVSDRVGFAFASGYQAAIAALVPGLDPGNVATFSVTEVAGNHPRSIRTKLEWHPFEGVTLSGTKRWSTMGPLAEVIVAIATDGDEGDRPRLVAVVVKRSHPGVTVTEMEPTPFVPEVPHAEITFDAVELPREAVLSGDGWDDFTKAFRTVEDIHVQAALLGYLSSVALRHGWPANVSERFAARLATASSAAALDPRRAETHVVLAGLFDDIARDMADAEPHWALVADGERERWYRDRVLVAVASKARETRRERAWEALAEKRPR